MEFLDAFHTVACSNEVSKVKNSCASYLNTLYDDKGIITGLIYPKSVKSIGEYGFVVDFRRTLTIIKESEVSDGW